ncbi:hypothetical protein PAXRUDRAFT_828866 [Paxillus rubicundulus Ve08.2h10]|uniref:Uncharacterized protein n=1 Tax=Paxillus rubicundulus Ve08.2h10 TaxID=930991 RepID=A0A0D0E0T1_9AGAM|nr:hypothetical protein PAXRUDRAFT_828866 [Paxillus rubicundulus Ve08.2h10]
MFTLNLKLWSGLTVAPGPCLRPLTKLLWSLWLTGDRFQGTIPRNPIPNLSNQSL